ncbi:MAG: hypothetical protein GX660_26365 [Clostridiaceae bacterium]|nr:hypothetical protein [Clostridiaceae bacterium]
MKQTFELLKMQKVKAVIDKVRELNGSYEIIAKIEDRQKQSQTIDVILSIDTNPIDINSLDGWNQYVRRGNVRHLILQGVVPTEENLKKYQSQVNTETNKILKNLKPYSVPVVFRNKNNKMLSRSLAY